LNVAHYVTIIDEAGVALFDHLGMGEAYTKETGGSWVVLENHITYDNELRFGERVGVETQFIDYDQKRLHLYHEIRPVDGNGISATCEQMTMFFDLNERRPAPFPPHVMKKIELIADSHSKLPRPDNLGRKIGIRKPKR